MDKILLVLIFYLAGSVFTALKTIKSMIYKKDFMESGIKLSQTKDKLYYSILLAIVLSWIGPLYVGSESLIKKILKKL